MPGWSVFVAEEDQVAEVGAEKSGSDLVISLTVPMDRDSSP
jgi:hypothetical protein